MLSQTVGYAIRAFSALVLAEGRWVLVRDLARQTAIPPPYLAKIMRVLARAGFVSTRRGIAGGVRARRSPESVTLFELCQTLHDPLLTPRCMLGTEECSDERACPAHVFHSRHREAAYAYLRGTTVADFVAFSQAKELLSPEEPSAAAHDESSPAIGILVPVNDSPSLSGDSGARRNAPFPRRRWHHWNRHTVAPHPLHSPPPSAPSTPSAPSVPPSFSSPS